MPIAISSTCGPWLQLCAPSKAVSRERSRFRGGARAACRAVRSAAHAASKLVGRDDAVQRIRQELLVNRFVSILGTGGIGKTTVALAVAESLLAEFAQSVVFIDLAPLRNQRMVTSAFATALGLPVRGENETASIIATLDAAKMLLIIDNCEHVIGAVAELTEKIFDAAPRVHLLATTREPLRVHGEKIYRLQGLAFPGG